LAKKHGVKKFVAVCPIEHELYWSEDKHTPIEVRDEAQQKALQANSNMTILNSNLVFGKDSYLLHYMTQCVAAGKISKSIGGSKGFHYKPISGEDLTTAVETAFNTADAKGKRFAVNGTQTATLNDLLGMTQKLVGNDNTKLASSLFGLGLSDYVEEFFTGITHDKNMGRMAEFFDTHSLNLEADQPDFFKQFGLSQKVNLQDYYGGKRVKEEDLVFPIFTSYKTVSLD
jgi:hypothetical protein